MRGQFWLQKRNFSMNAIQEMVSFCYDIVNVMILI